MSDTAIFVIGVLVTLLCVAFVVVSALELRRLGREAEDKSASR